MTDRAQLSFAPASGGPRLQTPDVSSLLSGISKGPGMSSLLSTIGAIPQGPRMSSLLSTMITDDLLNSLTGADSTRSTTGFSLEADGHGARLPSHIAAETGCLTNADAALLRASIVIIAALWFIQLHLEGNELLRFLQDRVDDVALAVLLTSPLLRLLRLDRPR